MEPIRVAGLYGSGTVGGLDLTAALRLAEARGFDLGVVSELLEAAEAGMIESLGEKPSCDGLAAWKSPPGATSSRGKG